MFNFDPNRQLVGFLVRHGELNRMSIWDGWGNYTLSEEGKQQAEKAAQWLSFERIGRVIASDTARTLQTAQYIMDSGNVLCPFLGTESNLRPWMVSDFTGKEKTPENIAAFKKYVDDPDLVIPGGESRNQLHERVQVLFTYLATPYKGLPTAFVIHNSVIKSIMGLDDIRDAVDPGGVIAIYMDEQGNIDFNVVLGETNLEKGVS